MATPDQKKPQTATVRLTGLTAQHFDRVKKDLMDRVPSMKNPHNTDVLAHGLYLAAYTLPANSKPE